MNAKMLTLYFYELFHKNDSKIIDNNKYKKDKEKLILNEWLNFIKIYNQSEIKNSIDEMVDYVIDDDIAIEITEFDDGLINYWSKNMNIAFKNKLVPTEIPYKLNEINNQIKDNNYNRGLSLFMNIFESKINLFDSKKISNFFKKYNLIIYLNPIIDLVGAFSDDGDNYEFLKNMIDPTSNNIKELIMKMNILANSYISDNYNSNYKIINIYFMYNYKNEIKFHNISLPPIINIFSFAVDIKEIIYSLYKQMIVLNKGHSSSVVSKEINKLWKK